MDQGEEEPRFRARRPEDRLKTNALLVAVTGPGVRVVGIIGRPVARGHGDELAGVDGIAEKREQLPRRDLGGAGDRLNRHTFVGQPDGDAADGLIHGAVLYISGCPRAHGRLEPILSWAIWAS